MANQSFWSTTSGMATGVAGTLTGLVALAGIAAQVGWIGGADHDAKPEVAGGTSTSTSPDDASSTTTSDEYGSTDEDRTATSDGSSRDDSATTASTGGSRSGAGSPTYTVDPTTVAFDALGTKTKSVTVRNTGTVDLVVQDVDVDGAGATRFAVSSSSCTSAPVDPGRSCALEVAFTPPSSGEVEATLVVDVEDARTREVPLSGKAIL